MHTPKETNKQESKEPSSGGSVLAEKHFEPLEVVLKAYESCVERHQAVENQWMTYPNAELEKLRLEMCKKMIETAQALLEPLPECQFMRELYLSHLGS